MSREHTRLTISQYLNDNLLEKGKDVVLVVDEAHLLDRNTLEDIRLLTNTDFDRTPPLTVILLGQLSLRGRVKTANCLFTAADPHYSATEDLDMQ